jgi:hypothetical protein
VAEASGGDLAMIYSLQSQPMTMQEFVARGGHSGLSSAAGIVDGMVSGSSFGGGFKHHVLWSFSGVRRFGMPLPLLYWV